jgi:hypothetical protein
MLPVLGLVSDASGQCIMQSVVTIRQGDPGFSYRALLQNSDAQLFYCPQWRSCSPRRNSALRMINLVLLASRYVLRCRRHLPLAQREGEKPTFAYRASATLENRYQAIESRRGDALVHHHRQRQLVLPSRSRSGIRSPRGLH